MDTLERGLQASREIDEGKPQASPAATSLSPIAVVALSALGIVLGSAIVLHLSPWGSLGRYQAFLLKNTTIVRMDTTSGAISACYYDHGNIGKPLTCFPWSQTSRDFLLATDPNTAQ
ncbi:hypothetical protein GR197_31170 [Rhizobium phaseoli]|uniref:Uncharacterized protein n=1 Tax=Rhizobium phaseoli TaxID=396 RepID=A0A7K3UMM3_9HYPH|nr:hypothetical protein [Rhizobium phaseoli]NEJ74927.1 hypothetical protein [Rhizobium phaseoli]